MRGREKTLLHAFENTFDVLVIGGGATGAGIALDATLRGYKTILVERGDFASGSSSKSTKLLHGGVRYLEKAFRELDWKQLSLVRESLRERDILMKIAPHLTKAIPIILPVYSVYRKAYYWAGLKFYEWLAGTRTLGTCSLVSADMLCEKFPFLSKVGLKGGVQYFDGQFDDARLNIAIIQTAVREGCCALNYVKAEQFIKRQNKICGIIAADQENGIKGNIHADVVINATGVFADQIRMMDDSQIEPMLKPSRGSHIVLNKDFANTDTGFLITTFDERVIFGLPWQGKLLVGTTDTAAEPEYDPHPSEEEIQYLLVHLNNYFANPVKQEDIAASWSGIRPLYKGMLELSTKNILRDYHIECSQTGLYTIAGGKWTTYRVMAKNLLDRIIKEGKLPEKKIAAARILYSLVEKIITACGLMNSSRQIPCQTTS